VVGNRVLTGGKLIAGVWNVHIPHNPASLWGQAGEPPPETEFNGRVAGRTSLVLKIDFFFTVPPSKL
jgi:hypothetical protein